MLRYATFYRHILVVCAFCISLSHFSITYGAESNKLTKVVIDAGHGGKDPGAIGKQAYEKDITLKIALKAGAYIEKYLPDVEVIYTRKTDRFVELHERARIANDNNADLFISIHVNAASNHRAYGTSSHVLGASGTNKNMAVAMRENRVIELEEDYTQNYESFDPNSPESYIIFQFMQGLYQEQSWDLADKIQNQFSNRVGRRNRGVESNLFLVLHQTKMPAVLVETGFITNSAEEKFLNSTKGQDYMASAIFRAFRDYKKQIDKKSNINYVERLDIDNDEPEDEVVFKLQVITSKRDLTQKRKFADLPEFTYFEEGNLYKYTSGKSSNIKEIVSLKNSLKDKFPDAFIVAFKNGEKIPVSEAKKLLQNKL